MEVCHSSSTLGDVFSGIGRSNKARATSYFVTNAAGDNNHIPRNVLLGLCRPAYRGKTRNSPNTFFVTANNILDCTSADRHIFWYSKRRGWRHNWAIRFQPNSLREISNRSRLLFCTRRIHQTRNTIRSDC